MGREEDREERTKLELAKIIKKLEDLEEEYHRGFTKLLTLIDAKIECHEEGCQFKKLANDLRELRVKKGWLGHND